MSKSKMNQAGEAKPSQSESKRIAAEARPSQAAAKPHQAGESKHIAAKPKPSQAAAAARSAAAAKPSQTGEGKHIAAAAARIAGIDVSKRHLDACADGRAVRRFDNTAAGICRLLDALRGHGITRAVCEASGGYEAAMVAALMAAEFEVVRAHPTRARSFARATGVEAKTDALDARGLREYGMRVDLPLLPADEPYMARLRPVVCRRRQLVDMRAQERTRQDKTADAECLASHRRLLAYLDKEIAACERAIAECLKAPGVAERAALYASVHGVGANTAAVLLAYLPELGARSGPALVALVGLAPFNRDSGRHAGRRSIRGGRAVVRRALFMAAMSVLRHDCELRNFYRGLKKRGKPGKVALVAVMRKLLLQLNAVAHRGTPWVPEHNPVK